MFLGIDTSCYTTSCALLDEEGRLVADERILLRVPPGRQGLRQANAFYQHVQNLPCLAEKIRQAKGDKRLLALGVSSRPRPISGSHMPVFTAGLSWGQSLAALLDIPLVKTSHQEGHLAAGLWAAGKEDLRDFLAVHLSGGTTEILLVNRTEPHFLSWKIRVLGQATDIPAGQLVDRVGVALGLAFPAGAALEKLAASVSGRGEVLLPAAIRGLDMSFSGAETKAKHYLAKGASPGEIARAIEDCLASSLGKVIRKAIAETGRHDVLLVGGVCSNRYLRERLQKRLEHRAVGARLYYPKPCYCSDNAVGTAVIAKSLKVS